MCGIGEMFSEAFFFLCKYFALIFNIVSACLIHKRDIGLRLNDFCDKFVMG